jgi:hypothetical protein
MLIIKLIMAMLLPALSAGAMLLYLLRPLRMPWPFVAALSYILGMGLVAIWMMVLGFCGLPLSWPFVAWPLVLNLCIFSTLIYCRRGDGKRLTMIDEETAAADPGWPARGMIYVFYASVGIYIALNLYDMFWRAFVMPVYTWDAIATIAFKAKVLFYHQSFDIYPQLPHAKYPLLVTFLETWTALNLGQWHEQFVKAIFPLGSVSFLVVCYYFLRMHTNKAWGLIGICLILSSNMYLMHSSISYRDLYVTIFFCLTIVFLLFWDKLGLTPLMWLAGFFAGAASFSKYEGSGYVLLLLAVAGYLLWVKKELAIGKKIAYWVRFAIPSMTIMLSYHIYKKLFTTIKLTGNEERDTITFVVKDLNRIPETLLAYLHCMVMQSNWGIVWFIFGLSLVPFLLNKKTIEKQLILLSIVLFLGLYVALAVATPSFKWLVGPERLAGLPRLFLHFFPLAALFIVLNCHEKNFLGLSSRQSSPPSAKPTAAKIKKRKK